MGGRSSGKEIHGSCDSMRTGRYVSMYTCVFTDVCVCEVPGCARARVRVCNVSGCGGGGRQPMENGERLEETPSLRIELVVEKGRRKEVQTVGAKIHRNRGPG